MAEHQQAAGSAPPLELKQSFHTEWPYAQAGDPSFSIDFNNIVFARAWLSDKEAEVNIMINENIEFGGHKHNGNKIAELLQEKMRKHSIL